MAEEKQEESKEEAKEEQVESTEESKEESTEEVKDKHGQVGINKERHEKEMAAKDAKIKELEGALEEKSKTEEGRGEFKSELETLKAELEEERVTHKLEMAGCKNAKAAKALLDDHDGDVSKLKEAEPWLFNNDKQKGSTGKKPVGAASGADERRAKAREAAGLPPIKE